jgi:hypothetical protein
LEGFEGLEGEGIDKENKRVEGKGVLKVDLYSRVFSALSLDSRRIQCPPLVLMLALSMIQI